MDDFDFLSTPSSTSAPQQINTDNLGLFDAGGTTNSAPVNVYESFQENDFLGTENAPNRETTNQLNNDQSTASFNIENTLTNTFDSSSNFDNNMFSSQLNSNELDTSLQSETSSKTNSDSLYDTGSSYNVFPIVTSSTNTSVENLSPLQAFNQRHQQEIAKKDALEKQKIEELRQQAKRDIERWYEDRKINMERKRVSIKDDENMLRQKSLEISDKNNCDWAKVIRFLEFSQGTQLSKGKRELTRMKSIIIRAKRDKDSPNSSDAN